MTLTLFLPSALTQWIQGRLWLHVRSSTKPRLVGDGWSIPIELHRAKALPPALEGRTGKRARCIPVVHGYLGKQQRAALEAADVGYLDVSGRLHLPWSEGVIHVEVATRTLASIQAKSWTLGVHGVRAVQFILEHPAEIQVKTLAARTQLSLSGTHSVLKLLEGEGLVRATGSGPATRRTVVDRSRLLDWLTAQPAARRRDPHLDVSYYARTPIEGWRRIGEALDRADIRHAFTGSAAAATLGVGPTNVLMATVRIDPATSLETVAEVLGAEATERGANLRLLRDTGRVGSIGAVEHERVRIAPPARIYLDILSDKRGEDVAAHFREVKLGY